MIRLENVRFDYEAMKMHFDMEIGRGELLALIGPSGAGKSTLMALIAGFEKPVGGRILIDESDVTEVPPADRPVTMVFQDYNTFAHLDVWTNVALGVSPALKLDRLQMQKVDEALARTGLASLARRLPGDISGGERQRVAIARALTRQRPVLLLDEPFAALGPGLRRQMLDLIIAIRKEKGLTVVFVSHQPEDALYAATHTAFLDNGRVVAKRRTSDLFAATDVPALQEYLGL